MQDKKSRSLKLNIVASMVIQVISMVINLISKRAIRYYLGVEYLGMQSIYSNFCDVLTFAFFGMGTAMLFSLYGALAKGDKERMAAYYRYYDKLYSKIAGWVLAGGIVCTVLALYSVNGDISALEICITYLTYMLSIVFLNRHMVRNYFIQADQRRYFVAWVNGGVDAVALVIEILILKFFRSYEGFVICILIKNLLINLIFKWYLKKHYPFLFEPARELYKDEKKAVDANVLDMVVYKFGTVLINNTDSIFISRYISTMMVGIYSNYQFILYGIQSLLGALFEAIRSRVGYKAQVSKLEEQYKGLKMYLLINAWLMGITIICFYFLINDFIHLWMGEIQLLPREVILILIINFYLEESHDAVRMYREAAGLFHNIRKMILAKGILNIILSFLLGKYWGIHGILVATTISAVVTLFWYEPKVVFGYFKKGLRNEILYHIMTLALLTISFFITNIAVQNLQGEGILAFILKALVCAASSNLVYVVIFTGYIIKRRVMASKT